MLVGWLVFYFGVCDIIYLNGDLSDVLKLVL